MSGIVPKAVEGFQKLANPKTALGQAAYMRNQFAFLGITAPERKALEKDLFKSTEYLCVEDLERDVHALWQKAEREYQSLAVDLIVKNRDLLKDLSLCRRMIVEKSWWDTVDMIASNIVGHLLRNGVTSFDELDAWITDENFWIRRTAILAQLKHKKETNQAKLFEYCLQCAEEKEFFIRKAIGWALREYSKTRPKAVADFITKHATQFSGITLREARKFLK